MDNNTYALLNKLAEKLGTTADKLWAVLIHQAPIYAIETLIQCLLLLLVPLFTWMGHKWLSANEKYDDIGGWGVAMILFSLISIAIFVFVIFEIGDIINGFFNPNYWALRQIFNAI